METFVSKKANIDISKNMNYAVYWRTVRYIRPYLRLVIICLVLSLIISVFHFGSLGMIKPICDLLFTQQGSEKILNFLMEWGDIGKWLAEFLKTHVLLGSYRPLYIIMGVSLAMVVIKNALRFLQEYIAGYITHRSMMDISNQLFTKVEHLPISYFSNEGTSQISTRFISDIPMMGKGLHALLNKAIQEPLKAVASILLALMLNWQLTLITCTILPAAAMFLHSLGKRIKRNAKKTLQQRSNIMAILQETFTGMRIVKAYQMEQKMFQKFSAENQNLFRYEMKVVTVDASTNPCMEVFVVLAGVGIMMFSAHQVISGTMTIGDFGAFYAALAALFDPIRKLADLNNIIGTSIAGGERVFELMDVVPAIQDKPNAKLLEPVQEKIEFNNVSFAYQDKRTVLHNLSFSVPYGEKIAIVGRSGSGKSTLISLLLRLYDVKDGAIYFDGHDVRDVTLASLRSQIGLVTQEAFLFHDTINANICCSQTANPDKILLASQSAYADEFIQKLSQQYTTLYGPKGTDLSGGQKHRISLARAMYKEPRILILDEAMANLDAESESYILKALDTFTQNRTTFIIAHRFSTIQKVDKILVLDDGKLVGFGKHNDLIQTCPVYQNLYEKQMLSGLSH